MFPQLNTVKKLSLRSLIGATVGAFIGLTVALLCFTDRADAISCGEAECYVSSSPATNSVWEKTPEPPQGTGVGVPATTRYEYLYVPCRSWALSGSPVESTYPISPRSCSNIPHAPICHPLPDRSATGWVEVFIVGLDGKRFRQGALCSYPTDEYAPIERKLGEGKIYVGGRAEFYQTAHLNTATVYSREGTLTDTTGYVSRGAKLSNAEAYAGAWKPAFMGKTGRKANGDPLYGYYRLLWDLDYKVCEKWGYPSWLNKPARYNCDRSGQDRLVETYTYACNLSPALRQGVASDADFRPSACEQSWSCSVPAPISFNGYPADLSTMRNGVPLTVEFPSLIVHTPASDRVRSVRDEQLRVNVVEGSTPWNKDFNDANSKQQYFASSWEWGRWQSSLVGELRFYWASEPNRPFSITADYRFTADFYVFSQDSLTAGTTTRFAADTVECGQKTSAEITVLRSTSEG